MVGKLVKLKCHKKKTDVGLVISRLRGMQQNQEYHVYNVLFEGIIRHYFAREMEIIE